MPARSTRERRPGYDYNVATLPAETTENARNLDHARERVAQMTLLAFDQSERVNSTPIDDDTGELRPDAGFVELIDVRFWTARGKSASVTYCSIWVRDHKGGRWFAGYGTAGGGGYHKPSAALDAAIRSAGITLEGDIHGAGERPMEHALHAIAVALGYGDRPRTIVH